MHMRSFRKQWMGDGRRIGGREAKKCAGTKFDTSTDGTIDTTEGQIQEKQWVFPRLTHSVKSEKWHFELVVQSCCKYVSSVLATHKKSQIHQVYTVLTFILSSQLSTVVVVDPSIRIMLAIKVTRNRLQLCNRVRFPYAVSEGHESMLSFAISGDKSYS
eukprot:755248-Hanusia_phi.AAC.5